MISRSKPDPFGEGVPLLFCWSPGMDELCSFSHALIDPVELVGRCLIALAKTL
jgi:hypothetical protein